MIVQNSFVVDENATNFANAVSTHITNFQNAGLKVEIQYQPMVMRNGAYDKIVYSAYILGRKA
ncbi:MAG: hypothetical protein IJX98_03165 [Clostridia bacterium]|nr:hypothetical protein [Clostridia bacterium]